MSAADAMRRIVLACCEEHNLLSKRRIDLQQGDEAALFSASGAVDSIGLVGILVAIEQELKDQLGIKVSLTDRVSLAVGQNPFTTVGALHRHVLSRVPAQ